MIIHKRHYDTKNYQPSDFAIKIASKQIITIVLDKTPCNLPLMRHFRRLVGISMPTQSHVFIPSSFIKYQPEDRYGLPVQLNGKFINKKSQKTTFLGDLLVIFILQ